MNEARKKLGQTIIISGLTAEPVEHLAPTLADIPIMSIFRQRPFHVKADRISLAELRNHEVQPNRRVHINLEDDIVVSEIILPYLKTVENKFKEMLRNHIEKDNLSDTDKIILNGDITGPDTDFKELENFAQNKIAERLKAYSAIAGKKLEQNPNYKDAVILAIGLELRNSHIYKGYVQKISMFYQSVPNLEDCFIALQNIREISIPNFESEKKSTLMLKKIVDKILTQN